MYFGSTNIINVQQAMMIVLIRLIGKLFIMTQKKRDGMSLNHGND